MNNDGIYNWVSQISGSNISSSQDITVDKNNNLYLTGGFDMLLIIDNNKEYAPGISTLFLARYY